jgi:sugar-phosphatase
VIDLWVHLPGEAPQHLRCAAILFDMDGTLVDSSIAVEKTWRMWAARHGLDADALIAFSHGRQNRDTIAAVAPHLDLAAEVDYMLRAEEECRDGIVPVPGAVALLAGLAALPHAPWAVVTSAWRRLAEIRLGCAGLPPPPLLITSDDITRGKPDPQGYLTAAAQLGLNPADCVVLEDAPAGIAAGKAAGMTVIALATTMRREELAEQRCVDDLRALSIR